ncbi:MAG TPA: amidohydrolase family protein [Solirubrobacteraceae bacterium]|nr:amidohydrolase family protein [Solirubrobacteraceae bacterium]
MIDTHAHAMPAVSFAPAAKPIHDALALAVNRLVPSRAMLEVESLSTLERTLPRRGFSLLEDLSQLAAMPPAMVGGTLRGLLASMARHGIARTVLIGARGQISNRWLLEEAWRQAPDRLVPVTTLPELSRRTTTLEQWVDAYRELAEAGAAGFKIHPNWDGVLPGHPSYDAAFEVAQDHGRFIIVHTGSFHVRTYRNRAPLKLDDLRPYLERFPDVRVCLGHMNRGNPEAVWELQRAYDQVYTDTSWQPAHVIRRAIDAVGSDRLMLGSDWPLRHLGLQREACRTVERAASGAHLQNIVDDAPRRFIGAGTWPS